MSRIILLSTAVVLLSLTVDDVKCSAFHSTTLLNFDTNDRWRRSIAFATTRGGGGGFGSSSSSSKSNKSRNKQPQVQTKKDLNNNKTVNKTVNNDESTAVLLDRFGLPIRTADNFFPPLPLDTELIPIHKNEPTMKVMDMKECTKHHFGLNFDLFDNDTGIEKRANDDRDGFRLRMLHQSPPVFAIDDFFTSQECQEYMDLTKSTKDNTTSLPVQVKSATFSQQLAYSKRTSTTWYFHYKHVPTLLAKVKRIFSGVSLSQMEEAQVVRYKAGEEFSWHYDEIPQSQLHNGGQRVATLLVYLTTTTATDGTSNNGATVFRDLKLRVQPTKGSALLFFPAFADGTPDHRTLHKGEKIVATNDKEEEKWIAQIWIHQYPSYQPILPEGNSQDAAELSVTRKEMELGYSSSSQQKDDIH